MIYYAAYKYHGLIQLPVNAYKQYADGLSFCNTAPSIFSSLTMSKVLFVFTSANTNLTGGNTGWYLPEAAHPYYVLAPTHEIDFVSPNGPNPPVDEYSVKV